MIDFENRPWKKKRLRLVRYHSLSRVTMIRKRTQRISYTGMMHWGDDHWGQVWFDKPLKYHKDRDMHYIRPVMGGLRPGMSKGCFTGWDCDINRFVCKGYKWKYRPAYRWTVRQYRTRVYAR